MYGRACTVAWLVSLLSVGLASCDLRNLDGGAVPGSDGGQDLLMSVIDNGGAASCGPALACPSPLVCYQGRCVQSRGPCCGDNECQNDTHCTGNGADGGQCGVCVPFQQGEHDAMCMGQGFSSSAFLAPVDRCKWPLPSMNPPALDVVMTPLVVDLDGDGKPEIVFAPQNGSGPERLVAIHGADCTQLYDVDAGLQAFSQIAAADLDGDGKPEIVGIMAGNPMAGHSLAVFSGQTGAKLAQSTQTYQVNGVNFDCSGPAIADLDGDGKPELIAAGMVARYNQTAKTVDVLWNKPVAGGTWGSVSVANDMDGDGRLEVISGTQIFDGLTGADKTPSVMAGLSEGGYPAIGDFNGDGWPDLVLVQSQRGDQHVSVVDVHNNKFLLGPMAVPNGWGGPPTVADFDGDGTPDIGTAGPSNYFVFSLDCLQTPKPPKCKGSLPGVLWQSQTKDVSSGGTASSVFDFNGDGRAKVVYRDECWLRVYNGPDGKTLFARPITSGTALELPVIADVDNDGHADLVVPSDSIQGPTYCQDQSPEATTGQTHTGPTQGVFVLRDPMNRWMPSRSIWNQHGYHITNIGDSATVPRGEQPNWKSFNNYRQNVQGATAMPVPQGDLTAQVITPLDQGDCVKQWVLWGEICNRGDEAYGPGIPAAFYSIDPRTGGKPVCVVQTQGALVPGKCEVVSCVWNTPPQTVQDLWFRVNDDGNGGRPQTECKNQNDVAFKSNASCGNAPG